MTPALPPPPTPEQQPLNNHPPVPAAPASVAENWASYGEWIQAASRKPVSEATRLAAGIHQQVRSTFVFASDSGWYIVALGPYATGTAAAARDRLISVGAIPKDSQIKTGAHFGSLVWGDHPDRTVAPTSHARPADTRPNEPQQRVTQCNFFSSNACWFKQRLDRRIGKPVADYEIDNGPYKTSFDLSDNQRAFQWVFTGTRPGILLQNGGMMYNLPPSTVECTVTLIAKPNTANPSTLSNWIVSAYKYNGC